MADLDDLRRHAAIDMGLAVVATTRTDGSVHQSVVNAGVVHHPLTGVEVVGFVVKSSAHKIELMRQCGRASLTFRRGYRWIAVEGRTDLVGPDGDESAAGIDMPDLLRAVFVALGGTHPDWDEFDRVMNEDRRLAVLVHPDRIIGQPITD